MPDQSSQKNQGQTSKQKKSSPKNEPQPFTFPVRPWPDGKPMRQLDELGVMMTCRELRLAVRELQERIRKLEARG